MLKRKLFAVLVTLTLVFTLTPLSAFAEEVMDGTSPPVQVEAAGQTGELVTGEETGENNESEADEVPEEVPEEEDGNDDSGGIIPDAADAKADKAAPKAVAAAAVTDVDTRSYELTVIGEEKTPLAGDFLDSECCILHLLIMLLATAVLIWYTNDMKQHQKRILELEDQLDLH